MWADCSRGPLSLFLFLWLLPPTHRGTEVCGVIILLSFLSLVRIPSCFHLSPPAASARGVCLEIYVYSYFGIVFSLYSALYLLPPCASRLYFSFSSPCRASDGARVCVCVLACVMSLFLSLSPTFAFCSSVRLLNWRCVGRAVALLCCFSLPSLPLGSGGDGGVIVGVRSTSALSPSFSFDAVATLCADVLWVGLAWSEVRVSFLSSLRSHCFTTIGCARHRYRSSSPFLSSTQSNRD